MNTTDLTAANDHADRMKRAFVVVDPTCKELGPTAPSLRSSARVSSSV